MDSPQADRYAEAMRSLPVLLFLAGITLLTATDTTVAADDAPVLAVLEYRGGLLAKRANIRKAGGKVKSPYANLRQTVWTLRPGDTLRQEYRPRERTIQFLKLTGHAPQLLCSVLVRYVRSEKGWQPTYVLLQHPPMVCTEETQGSASKKADPTGLNTVGFTQLSFGFSSRVGQIDGWMVH